jgi:hypothetical protein
MASITVAAAVFHALTLPILPIYSASAVKIGHQDAKYVSTMTFGTVYFQDTASTADPVKAGNYGGAHFNRDARAHRIVVSVRDDVDPAGLVGFVVCQYSQKVPSPGYVYNPAPRCPATPDLVPTAAGNDLVGSTLGCGSASVKLKQDTVDVVVLVDSGGALENLDCDGRGAPARTMSGGIGLDLFVE